MVADGGLGLAGDRDEVAGADLTVRREQGRQDPQPNGVGQRLEDSSQVDRFGRRDGAVGERWAARESAIPAILTEALTVFDTRLY